MAVTLVLGGSGFVGSFICGHLLDRGHVVVATGSKQRDNASGNLDEGVSFEAWELGDVPRLHYLLSYHKPTWVYHLASPSHVPTAQKNPLQTAQEIFLSTAEILETVRTAAPQAKLLYVGSSEEYAANNGLPIDENCRVAGHSAYAIAKSAATQWVAVNGKDFAVCVRPFNQIGPHQSPRFAVASFARQVAAIMRNGNRGVLNVGNLDVERDFIDVRDSSLAHILALEHGATGEIYNIASEQSTKLRDILHKMIAVSGAEIEIKVDATRVRPDEIPKILGNAQKLKKATGWYPQSTPFKAAEDALMAATLEASASLDKIG
jgi:GDP-4-dehydro-6-deoxy-D-mannose reductase